MSFLRCLPCVFVIENSYEILINTVKCGIVHIEIDGEKFYEENTGVLSSEKLCTKIRFPQSVLDKAEKYTVVFRETIDRKAYFSVMGEEEKLEFAFKPLRKTENINIYHISDVHYLFDVAKKTASYFGDDVDLFIVNGDIGEVETVENYIATAEYVGEISGGKIPVVFSRGNHDTRGRLAELYPEYFPVNGKKTYFTFEIGCISGIVLDCGEDKPDNHLEPGDRPVYNGTNVFELYRREELKWLKSLPVANGKIKIAISHICPMHTTQKKGDIFDIERELYTEWRDELERLKTDFMVCGHLHRTFILPANNDESIIRHNFPVITGTSMGMKPGSKDQRTVSGAALTVSENEVSVIFTNEDKKESEKEILHFNK